MALSRWWTLVALGTAAVVAGVVAVVAVRVLSKETGTPVSGARGTPSASPPAASPSSAAPALTPRQAAGRRIVYSYPGLTPPASLFEHIRNGEAAGVIFFSENISGVAQIAGVVGRLREAQRQSPVAAPLLLMTDQEGGQVRRLPGQPVESAKRVGRSADSRAAAARTGAAAASTLTAAGMNVNLAPVLDV